MPDRTPVGGEKPRSLEWPARAAGHRAQPQLPWRGPHQALLLPTTLRLALARQGCVGSPCFNLGRCSWAGVERVALALTHWLGAPSPSWGAEHVLLTVQGGVLSRGTPSRPSVTLSHGCPVAVSLPELSLVVSPPAAGVKGSVQTLALGGRAVTLREVLAFSEHEALPPRRIRPRGLVQRLEGPEAPGSERPLSAFTRVTSVGPDSPCEVNHTRPGAPLSMPHFWPVLGPRPLRPANAPTLGALTLSGREPGVFWVGPPSQSNLG